jgi:hypothetical protein
MKVLVYKDNLCMIHPTNPEKSSGTIKKFNNAKDVDNYIDTLCISMTLLAHRQFRVFIANDDVDQSVIDHYVIMDDNYELDMVTKNFKEVNTLEVAAACDERLRERSKIIRPRTQMVRA